MATKVIYFTFNGMLERAEFSTLDTASEVKDLFRSAAEVTSFDIIKMYNSEGDLVNITQYLKSNTPDTPYRLVVLATSTDSLMKEVGTDLNGVEKRLQALESHIIVENGGLTDSMRQVQEEMAALSQKLEGIEHLSWIGLSKDINGTKRFTKSSKHTWHNKCDVEITTNNNWKKSNTDFQPYSCQSESDMDCETVFDKFNCMRDMEVRSEVKGLLESVNFNNWQWNEAEMLVLLRQMYLDLGLLDTFNIPKSTFHTWLCEVYRSYNRVPFHNFKHCFMVSQMMYGLIQQLDLKSSFSPAELFALLTSAVCHDLDHPGYNNSYQVNARTELAIRYNDMSVLENHHCSVAFRIFASEGCNILENMSAETYRHVRQCIIRCILATDMARHNEILSNFTQIIPTFDVEIADHRNQLMMILIKCADISNECRPMEVAEPWIDCLLQEFFTQSDLEKKEGLPVSPFMDRDKVNKNSSQVNFIKFILLPLFEALAELHPVIQDPIIGPLQDALEYYQKLSSSTNHLPATSFSSKPSALKRKGTSVESPQTNGV